nr:Chain B, activator peptide [synthetic construct]
AHQLLRYLLDA